MNTDSAIDPYGASDPVRIATFYRFTAVPGYRTLGAGWLPRLRQFGVTGTLVLAPEGVNGTLAGTRPGIDAALALLRSEPALESMPARIADCHSMPFRRLKIKHREEIVTLGVDGIDPASMAGTYVAPEDWNRIISDPGVVVIDTRNDYEVAIGTFTGARDPGTASFGEFPAWVESQPDLAQRPPVAMFCTGGIRCEKSTALMRRLGFETVYHLEGGILNDLERIPPQHSLWQGACFVFDERVSVLHGLRPGPHRPCPGCGRPIDAATAPTCPHCNP